MAYNKQAGPQQSESHESPVGFIVHPTWALREGVPEIHLYGRLQSGETFLAIDTRTLPRLYVRSSEAEDARTIAARFGCQSAPVNLRTMDGESTERITFRAPGKLGTIRRALAEANIRTYEADVPFAWSYLIDRHLRGTVAIQGD